VLAGFEVKPWIPSFGIGSEIMQRNRPISLNILTWLICLFAICCFFLVDNVHAQMIPKDDLNVSESSSTPPGSPSWGPPSALPGKFDWIELTSGEWLKGDLKVLYHNKLEFDSDKMDFLELDWKDVKQVRGHKYYSVRFSGPSVTVVGLLKVVDDKVYVTTEEKELEFDRSRLISIAYGESKELGYWSSKISLSLDIRSGNSDQINYSTGAYAQRRTSKSRFYADYLGVYNKSEGIETASSHRASSHYDIFKTKKIFWRPIFGEYFQDRFSNIQNRVTVGTGIGYYIIDTPKTQWDITPGIAYQYTQNASVESGQNSDNSTAALVAGTNFDTELSKKIDFNASYKLSIVNQESGTYAHHALAALEIELTSRLDLDFSFVWDRIQDPKPQDDGRIPNQDDVYFFFGLGFKL
jgi:putative salt-induced outer membrane protein YdiY